jgi:hypothetical protein
MADAVSKRAGEPEHTDPEPEPWSASSEDPETSTT